VLDIKQRAHNVPALNYTTTTAERMFVLVSIEEKIKVNPDLFDQDLTEVLMPNIYFEL
jgi:hypothetical protein